MWADAKGTDKDKAEASPAQVSGHGPEREVHDEPELETISGRCMTDVASFADSTASPFDAYVRRHAFRTPAAGFDRVLSHAAKGGISLRAVTAVSDEEGWRISCAMAQIAASRSCLLALGSKVKDGILGQAELSFHVLHVMSECPCAASKVQHASSTTRSRFARSFLGGKHSPVEV